MTSLAEHRQAGDVAGQGSAEVRPGYTSAPRGRGALAISLAVRRDTWSCERELTLRREHWGLAHVGDVPMNPPALNETLGRRARLGRT